MTIDTTPLQERIARILNDEGWTFEGVHEPGEYDECEDCRRVVDPIAARIAGEVSAEVRAASEKAWDDCAHEADRRWLIGGQSAAILHDRNPYRQEQSNE